ncbi:MAG TPA: GNAT family N-acetyltransferase [Xanthobacteraceae bacterium]|nr:GNAT family N-acetyltransferase [Xanthobacteraceae bacterium]
MNGPPLSIEEIHDAAHLHRLVPEWWSLWHRTPTATPFQSPAWLLPWWTTFSPGELHVIAMRDGDRLVGLAPFYIESTPHRRRLLPLGISLSDYLDVLLDPQVADRAGRALVDHMENCRDLWDEWEVCDLRPEALALRFPCPAGCTETSDEVVSCPVLALPPCYDGLRTCVPARKRRALRMSRHRAERRGAVDVVPADHVTAAAMFSDLVRLHRARWEQRGEPGVLDDPRVLRFHREALPGLIESGLARLYGLAIGGKCIAVYYGFQHGPCAYAYLGGFDVDYSFESPGTLLLGYAIERAVRDGAREFHFLRGREGYKYGWGAEDRPNRRRVFRRVAHHAVV